MAYEFVGEIRMFAGNYAPLGWMFCEGQLLPISEYETLFNLIGTTYGGDGQETFALPDLRGRVPVHQGNGFVIGQIAGVETVRLTPSQIPAHNHPVLASTQGGNTRDPAGAVLAVDGAGVTTLYSSEQPDALMNWPGSNSVGGNQPHENLQPYLCIDFIISLYGVFPSPN